ncbi:DUF3659 domain-containing protein [Cytophagaceae bacterium YF14B1]|uniref:DUF3659 domain-containing protein n=1 Tax=Xanthocytophaga flava TaxID=3048013 RepID=A0AAE3QNV1_9BACT|nr:DUF3659 domain-containing protein [Xanthocytophaga flavus]MDJ1482767.1 DUF3659 domain-containing protein [Xanthocytophaga flavus]
MKRNLFLLVALLLHLVMFAQQRPDFKGHVIDSKGDVYLDGTKVGNVTKEGSIIDASGKKLAYLDANGQLLDASGKKLGKMGKDGKTYYDANGTVMLAIKDNADGTCTIQDAKGKVIGNVHSSYKGMACSLHCFQNKMSMKDHSKH